MSAEPARVVAAGIDTWAPCWYLQPDGPAARALRALATQPGPRCSWLVPDAIAGHRVGWFPSHALAFAEGHPAPDGALAPVGALVAALEALEGALRAHGVPVPSRNARRDAQGAMTEGRAGLRRLDLAVDVHFDRRRDGQGALAVLAHVTPARGKRDVWFGPGGETETIYWRGYGGRRVLGRIYDKGVETGTQPSGRFVRLEDQRRFQAGRRPDVEQLTPASVHAMFAGRFTPLTQASRPVTAATMRGLAERVSELVELGDISETKASMLLGFLAYSAVGGVPARNDPQRSTYFRRRRELRKLGLVLLERVGDDVRYDVDLAQLFDAALGQGVWERLAAQAAA